MSRWVMQLGWAALLLAAPTTANALELPDQLQRCQSAWRQREQAVHTLRAEFLESQFRAFGLENPEDPLGPPTGVPATVTRRCHLWLSGNSLRHRHQNLGEGAVLEASFSETQLAVGLSHPGVFTDERHPYLTRSVREKLAAGMGLSFHPLLWTYRAAQPSLSGINLEESFLEPTMAEVDGHPCHIVSCPYEVNELPGVREYWVAPDLDWAVLRFVNKYRGQVFQQVELKYSRHASGVIIPIQWRSVQLNMHGTLVSSESVESLHVEINPEVKPADLEVHAPAGTIIRDLRTNSHYFVSQAGREVPIELADLNGSYEALAQRIEAGRPWYPFLAGTIFLLIILGLVAWRRYHVYASPYRT